MTFFPQFSLLFLLPFFFANSFTLGATLDDSEALKVIGNTLGKKDWSVDPCSGRNNRKTPTTQSQGAENAVTCNCSFQNNTVCHVVSVVLEAQNLSGTLPPDLVKLPYLQEISFYGNRLSGPIPKEFGKITTLKSLVLEVNQLSGSVPPELGNLHQIERLLLSSNNFTGKLPITFANFTSLKQFQISDNQFSGAIPNFIQSWINLEQLIIQGSGLSGPIPSGISLLKNLTELTITDLNGPDSPFPPLDNMSKLYALVLRSCNIIGTMPEYLGNMTNLRAIDLSNNKLIGKIPTNISNLPDMFLLDLTLNYLSGTIPKQWAALNLVYISMNGTRLSGPIPKEFGKITTLKILALEVNQLSGSLPPELGNLHRIERLLLSANNFTGKLPTTFAKLTTLKQFQISDNQFSGAIPNFIQNLTNLEKLVIRGSGLSGPIPSDLSLLKNLIETITDLNGPNSPFPRLDTMSKLSTLVLRSCNIIGKVPEHLGKMTSLTVIDLSNNKLSGKIPMSISLLQDTFLLALSGNQMSGSLPEWIDNPNFVDLSHNNFTITDLEKQTCQQGSVNLFAASLKGNSLGNISCLASNQCPKTSYSLYINCGGKRIKFDGNKTYDDDSSEMGAARFHQTETNWAIITAGHFLDTRRPDYYTWSNTTKLVVDKDAELYMDARVSPNSLTYYGFCLGNGNYTVNLHFAEIMFTDDKTYSSLGRRVFDIYIQGKLVAKDFNIAKEAGGVGKAIIKKFTAGVTSNAMEIRLYWAGKGTTTIPFGSVYGPLISAVSVDPDFTPPSENNETMPVGALVAIIAAVAIVIILILVLGIMWWKGCLRLKHLGAREIKGSQTGSYTLQQIKEATNNFDESFKIGEGGFGPVYKGVLSDGTIVAVKQLSSKSMQGIREFINEIGMISALQHPNLVKLYGFCMEDDQLLLLYEYMENNSLACALFVKKEDPEKHQLRLDWKARQRICVGIAKGLAYLHGESSRLKIVHRDIKANNVLLDKDLNPKISDFGLAKLNEDDKTHISTRIAGTYGYMAPEYAMYGYLTDKADVYSFGIVALEIVSGTNNNVSHPQEECFSLLDWVRLLKEKDNLMELVDQRLGEAFNKEEVMAMINVALLCTRFSASLRPSMSSVVSMLEGRMVVQEVVPESIEVLDDKKYKVMRQYYQQRGESSITEVQSQSIPTDESNAFISDTDSSYWESRNKGAYTT